MPPAPSPGAEIRARGRVVLSDRDRFPRWNGGIGREIEIELETAEGPTLRVRYVDWKQERRHGDLVQVTGTVETARPWTSGGRSFVTLTLKKGHRMTVLRDEPPALSEPEAIETSGDGQEPEKKGEDDGTINGFHLF